MSDLLSIGRTGVLAYQGALAAVGENVTNADTEGYVRRTVTMRELRSPAGPLAFNRTASAFGGVQPAAVDRVWDRYLATNAWAADGDAGRASTRLTHLTKVEQMLGDDDSGIGARLTAVFTAGARLASDPSDRALRQTMLATMHDAALAFNQTAANLATVADTVKTQAIVQTGQVNDQLTALADINLTLVGLPQGTAARAQLEDKRDQLIGAVAQTLAVDVKFEDTGTVSLTMTDGGPQLLAANRPTPAAVALDVAADGRLSISVVDGPATTSFAPTGGSLSALVDVSNIVAGRRQQLDGIAAQFHADLTSWQAGGVDLSGAAGAALLTGTTAATIALSVTDPDKIAAATTTGGDNANLLALTGLRGTGGVEAAWRRMVADQALIVSSAKIAETGSIARRTGAYTALDEVAGVDLDAEAADLMRFQQAYAASAKIIQAAREMFQSMLEATR